MSCCSDNATLPAMSRRGNSCNTGGNSNTNTAGTNHSTGEARPANIASEMESILLASGVDAASMDPSSACYLRELIALELEKEPNRNAPAAATAAAAAAAAATAGANAARNPLVAPATSASAATATTTATAAKQEDTGFREAASRFWGVGGAPRAPRGESSSGGLPFGLAEAKVSVTIKREEEADENDDDRLSSTSPSLRMLLLAQQKAVEDQSEVLRLLTDRVRELTNTVHSLQESVETLKGTPSFSSSRPEPSHPATTRAPDASDDSNNNNSSNSNNNSNSSNDQTIPDNNNNDNDNDIDNDIDIDNEFVRAHLLAHQIAWRIATFPVRAVFLYLKYEYRVWLVLYRLAKRDVLNPFREAGMIFQLGFALIIVYGRIAPALEDAVGKRRQREGNGDGKRHEDLLDDAEFQIQTLATAIVAAFLYHVGVVGLFYRFFIRDRMHMRIWNDLRDGVELTPTYGLHMDLDPPPADGQNQNENNNNNNNNNNNDDDDGNAENNNNENNAPPPPNRNNAPNNRDNIAADLANFFGNEINNFFMGHRRRRRDAERAERRAEAASAAQARNEGAPPEEGPVADENRDDHPAPEIGGANADIGRRNPVLGVLSDLLCLSYSFFVSILPIWNYEQQLQNIRDDENRRLEERLRREAEALRNQQQEEQEQRDDSDGDSDSDSDGDSEVD